MEAEKMGLVMATWTGRETVRVKTQNTDLKETILEGLGIVVALLRETDMALDLPDPKERDLPLEKLVREDLGSTEVVQEEDLVVQEEDMVVQEVVQDMCEQEGSIQEARAPAAGRQWRHSPSRRQRETSRAEKRVGATMDQEEGKEEEEVKIGRMLFSLLWEDPHKKEASCNFRNMNSRFDGLGHVV